MPWLTPQILMKESDVHICRSFSVFETTIRYLGGLLSAYELAQDPLMLDRALELGNWLLPALATSDGLPIGYYSIGHNPIGQLTYGIGLADAGSLTMEFTRLSMLSGDETFFQAVRHFFSLSNFGFLSYFLALI